jgi:hypothetical protein
VTAVTVPGMAKENKKGKRSLTTQRKFTKMGSVRQTIINRMKELDWTAYRLSQEVAGKMTPQTVYDYVADPQRTKINDEFVGFLLNALGLEIRPKE